MSASVPQFSMHVLGRREEGRKEGRNLWCVNIQVDLQTLYVVLPDTYSIDKE